MLLPRFKPGVSIAVKHLPSNSNRTSTLSRVVPGTSLTIIRSAWASVFTKVLLPVLRRPTMATFISASGGSVFSVSLRLGQAFDDHVEQLLVIPILPRAGADQLALAELVKFVGLGVELRVVGLVGHAKNRHVDVPQPAGHFFVERHQTVARIDYEQNHRGRFDRRVDLIFDVLGEVVGIVDAHAARIDQFEVPLPVAEQIGHAVAGDARGGIDDRQSLADEPIEQARFAHVGAADDDDLWNSHGTVSTVRKDVYRWFGLLICDEQRGRASISVVSRARRLCLKGAAGRPTPARSVSKEAARKSRGANRLAYAAGWYFEAQPVLGEPL